MTMDEPLRRFRGNGRVRRAVGELVDVAAPDLAGVW